MSNNNNNYGRNANQRMSKDHIGNSNVEICQNTEKSPGDMWRLAITRIRVKDHQLMLVLKTCKEYNDNDNNNQLLHHQSTSDD